MKKPVFTGANVAIITPMTESGVNLEELGRIIEDQIQNGTDSITICGTTGESSTLSDKEHRQAISYCIEKVAGRVPVVAGTGSNDTAYALELCKFASKEGADGLLTVTPYYNKTSQQGLIRHFNLLADASTSPLILYNVPSRTGMCFSASTYLALSKHPNISGVKEASGNFSLIAQAMALCGDELNFWSGNDDQVIPLMAMGGKGVISVYANIMPATVHKLTSLCLEGNFQQAMQLQSQYLDIINALFIDVNPIPVKNAMKMLGWKTGELRLPLCDLDDAKLTTLRNAMRNAGLPV